jgi:hypothetical protein
VGTVDVQGAVWAVAFCPYAINPDLFAVASGSQISVQSLDSANGRPCEVCCYQIRGGKAEEAVEFYACAWAQLSTGQLAVVASGSSRNVHVVGVPGAEQLHVLQIHGGAVVRLD